MALGCSLLSCLLPPPSPASQGPGTQPRGLGPLHRPWETPSLPDSPEFLQQWGCGWGEGGCPHLSVSGRALTCSAQLQGRDLPPGVPGPPLLATPFHLPFTGSAHRTLGEQPPKCHYVPEASPSPELLLKPSDSSFLISILSGEPVHGEDRDLCQATLPGSARHLPQGRLTLELGVPSPTTMQGSGMQVRGQDCWARVLAPPPPCWVTWGWLLHLSVPQILHQCRQRVPESKA